MKSGTKSIAFKLMTQGCCNSEMIPRRGSNGLFRRLRLLRGNTIMISSLWPPDTTSLPCPLLILYSFGFHISTQWISIQSSICIPCATWRLALLYVDCLTRWQGLTGFRTEQQKPSTLSESTYLQFLKKKSLL